MGATPSMIVLAECLALTLHPDRLWLDASHLWDCRNFRRYSPSAPSLRFVRRSSCIGDSSATSSPATRCPADRPSIRREHEQLDLVQSTLHFDDSYDELR